MEKKVTLNPDGDTFFSDDDMPGQKIIYGVGARNRVGEVAKELGRNILLVTDSGLSSVGHPQNLKEILEQSNLNVTLLINRSRTQQNQVFRIVFKLQKNQKLM